MHVQSNESTGLSLPPPIVEAPSFHTPSVETAPAQVEQAPLPEQKAPARLQPAAPALPAIPLPPVPAAVTPDPVPAASTSTTASAPVVADDNDLIEKEWVKKAKEIVERTRENPYQQSKGLNTLKADYMNKRYNKTLKLSE